jgi:hypothetical protein
MESGFSAGNPAYLILYGEGCSNSKQQARRSVSLCDKYKGRVQFIIVDLDRPLSPISRNSGRNTTQATFLTWWCSMPRALLSTTPPAS